MMNRMNTMRLPYLLVPLTLLTCACSGGGGAETPTSALPERFHLAAEPAGAKPVAEVHAAAQDGEEVVLVGAVGGSADAFVAGVAAFTIVDPALETCVEDGSGCPTPWDYCCEEPANLSRNTATIEFREADQLHTASPRGFHGLDHMLTVVVKGTAQRDDQGNLTVVAEGVHVRG
jgi:hypothetical protein